MTILDKSERIRLFRETLDNIYSCASKLCDYFVVFDWEIIKYENILNSCPGKLEMTLDGCPGNKMLSRQTSDNFDYLFKPMTTRRVAPGNL